MFTTNGSHSENSLHKTLDATGGRGRAIDLASFSGPGSNTNELLKINKDILTVIPLQFIRELIYSGPGGICVRNGVIVSGMAVYGPTVMAAHHNHVHLAVVKGFIYQGGNMPDDPNLPNIKGPVSLHVVFDSSGVVTGYYIFSQSTAEVHAFGDGNKVKYMGRSEVVA